MNLLFLVVFGGFLGYLLFNLTDAVIKLLNPYARSLELPIILWTIWVSLLGLTIGFFIIVLDLQGVI